MKTFIWFIYFSIYAHSSTFDVPLSSENERLMIAKFNTGVVLSDVYLIYDLDRTWLLPLETTSALLGFDITVFTKEKVAKGKIQNKEFLLDLNKCEFKVEDKVNSYPCHYTELYEDEIYVDSSYLQSLIDVEFNVFPYKSIVEFVAKEGIPIYDRMLRDRKFKMKQSQRKTFDTGFERYEQKPKTMSGYVIDQNLQLEANKPETGSPDFKFSHQTQVDAQIFKGQLHINTVGEDEVFDDSNILLRWKEYENEKYSHTQLGDIYTQSINLIGGGGSGQGISFSSYPFFSTYEFTSQDFEGTLPPNWEVEIYMNDTLINRTVVGPNGRYLFKDVPIFYGNNRVKFVYYGPQGQKQVEHKSINVGQNLLKKGKSQSVISFFNNESTDSNNTLFQVEYGLLKNLTMRAGYTKYLLNENFNSYGLFGASGYLGPLLLNYNYAQNTTSKGNAQQLATSFSFFDTYWNVSATILDKYSSSNLNTGFKDQKAQYKANLGFNIFSFLNLISTYESNEFEKSLPTQSLSQRMSFRLGPMYFSFLKNFFSEVNKDTYVAEYLFGNQRLTTEYTASNSEPIGLSVKYQKRLGYRSLMDVSDAYSYIYETHRYSVGVQKLLKKINLGMKYTYDELTKNHLVTFNLFYGLGYTPKVNKFFFTGSNQTNKGNASFFVYYDKNSNLKFDKGDKPIENAEITWVQNNQSFKTDDNGYVYFSDLPTFQDIDFEFKQNSLKDLNQFPVKDGVKLSLISGKPYHFDFIVQDLYEVEALIVENNEGKSSVPIIIKDESGQVINTVRSDSEGYALFEKLKKQKYIFNVDPRYLESKSYSSEPLNIDVSFENDEDMYKQLLFELEAK